MATCVAMVTCPSPAMAQGIEQIVLELPESWETTEPTGLADRSWKHAEHDITVQLIVLAAGDDEVVKDADDNDVEVTGTFIVEDWDEQFMDGGPMVEINEHTEQSRGGVKGVFGDLTWNNRRGLYFGFSSADIASSQGAPLERDRHAFFILCEGSTLGEADTGEVCQKVLDRLKVLP